ncbi:hypothetical protein BMT66_24295, partial [Escherichia coli]
GTVCVVGKIRDLILQLSKSSIYSTKPPVNHREPSTDSIETFPLSKYLPTTFCSKNLLFQYVAKAIIEA